jgi:protocatechuate 3,4-dioxygenase beta subunit
MTLLAAVTCAALLGSIAGRVTDADSGAPIAGARVTIAGPGTPGAANPLVTDEQGRFQRGGLAPGRYQLSAAARGYAAASGQWRETIVLDGADQSRDIRFRLHRGAVIAGYITDDYGDPIANLTVTLIEATGSPSLTRGADAASAITDDRGYYRFWGLRAGQYLVYARPSAAELAVTRASASPAATFYPGVLAPSQAEAIAVTPAAVIGDISFGVRYGRVSTLAVRVVNSTGGASRDARVSIRDAGEGGTHAIAAFPGDSPGRFIVPQLPPGDYEVVAVSGRRSPGVSYAIHPVTIAGDGGDVATELSLLAAGHVAGLVVADKEARPPPANAMSVSTGAARDGEAQFLRAPGDTVDPFTGVVSGDGRFSLAVLPGRRTLRLDGLTPGWAAQSIALNGREVLDREVTFSTGDAFTDARIVITDRLSVVTATVAAAEAGATVVLFSRDPGRWTPGTRSILRADTDDQGHARIAGVVHGDYFIAAVPREQSPRLLDSAVLAALAGSALPLDVRAGDPAPIALSVTRP